MYKPYKASIAIGKLHTAFYRQSNESSNAVFALATDKITSNTNSIRLKNSVPNSGSIIRGLNKTENNTTPLVNTALKNNTINGITGKIIGDVEIDQTKFFTDYSTYRDSAKVSFGGSQKPISINIHNTKDNILSFIDDTFNKPLMPSKLLQIIRNRPSGIQHSGVYTIIDPYHNMCPECPDYPECSPDPGLLGQVYIYTESEGWILYP